MEDKGTQTDAEEEDLYAAQLYDLHANCPLDTYEKVLLGATGVCAVIAIAAGAYLYYDLVMLK